jgi:hypothetical protein
MRQKLQMTRDAWSLTRNLSKRMQSKWRNQAHDILMLDSLAICCSLVAAAAAYRLLADTDLQNRAIVSVVLLFSSSATNALNDRRLQTPRHALHTTDAPEQARAKRIRQATTMR